jgi:tetratricopeptide (TPR) repeat protein
MGSRVYPWVALVVGLTIAWPAHAAPGLENEEAKAHFERAQEYFDEENYAAAVPELKAAYALEPLPSLLYAWAQAERFSGNCAKAIALYERFLETKPKKRSADLARANIVDCEAELAPPPVPDDAYPSGTESGSDTTDASSSDDSTDDGPPDDKPWHRDWVAGTLLGTGAAATIAGAAIAGISYQQLNRSQDAITEGDYFDEVDAARRLGVAGYAVLGVGAALIIGGAVRLAILGVRHKRRKSSANVLLGPRGATLRMRF